MENIIASVLHKAPVVHVSRGARRPRLDLVDVRTPVKLRIADERDLVLAVTAAPPNRLERLYYGFDGRLWSLIRDYRPKDSSGITHFLQPETLVRFLDRPQTGSLAPDLWHAFCWTPVIPRQARTHLASDAGIDPKKVVHDGTASAVAALHRYFRENVLVAGGRVYVQTPMPLLELDGWGRWSLGGKPHQTAHNVRYHGLDRPEEAYDEEMSLPEACRLPVQDRPDLTGVHVHEPAFLRNNDLLAQANLLPLIVEHNMRTVLDRMRVAEQDAFLDAMPLDMRTRYGLTEPWRMRAMTGTILLEEAAMVMAACEEVIHGLAALPGGIPLHETDARFLLGIPEKFARHDLPRLRAAGHAGASREDDDAMATL